jgi:hypothetical protein
MTISPTTSGQSASSSSRRFRPIRSAGRIASGMRPTPPYSHADCDLACIHCLALPAAPGVPSAVGNTTAGFTRTTRRWDIVHPVSSSQLTELRDWGHNNRQPGRKFGFRILQRRQTRCLHPPQSKVWSLSRFEPISVRAAKCRLERCNRAVARKLHPSSSMWTDGAPQSKRRTT